MTIQAHVYRFGAFELDTHSGELRRHGLRIRLPDQSFQILKLLLSRPGEVVSRDDLKRAVWTADTFVDFEVGLNSAVRKLREALDDAAESPRFVATVPRHGYRFIASVAPVSLDQPATESAPEPRAVVEPVSAKIVERPSVSVALPSADDLRSARAFDWRAAVLLVLAIMGIAGLVYVSKEPRQSDPIRSIVVLPFENPTGNRAATRPAPAAYAAYLKGLSARGLQRHEGFRQAVVYFEESLAIQPDFAEAHAELALTQLQFLFGGPYAPHQVIPKAEAAARRALELDDTLSKPHRVLGRILHLYHWRWAEGDEVLARQSQAGNDDGAEAITSSLLRHGRFDDAIAVVSARRRADPTSIGLRISLGFVYTAAGQYDRAVEELRGALAASPGNVRVHYQLGATLVAMGRLDEAIGHLEIAGRAPTGHNSRLEAFLGYAYALAGRSTDARRVLAELEAHRKDQYVSWYGVGLIHDTLGEKAPALAAVQRAFDDRAVEFAMFRHYPPFKTIASEPSFLAMMRQVGLPR